MRDYREAITIVMDTLIEHTHTMRRPTINNTQHQFLQLSFIHPYPLRLLNA